MCAAYAEYRERWNDMKHPRLKKSRREAYFSSVNKETEAIFEYSIMDMFWKQTELPSEFTSSGITIQVDNRSYSYEVFDEDGLPDLGFRSQNTGRQFFVKYDPDDMSKVWLCTETSRGLRRVRLAKPYVVVHRAIQEQSESETMFIRTMTEANKKARFTRQMEGYLFDIEHGIAPEQHGLHSSRIRGLSRRDQERIADEFITNMTTITTEEWQQRCEPLPVGEGVKMITNLTYDDIEARLINKF